MRHLLGLSNYHFRSVTYRNKQYTCFIAWKSQVVFYCSMFHKAAHQVMVCEADSEQLHSLEGNGFGRGRRKQEL